MTTPTLPNQGLLVEIIFGGTAADHQTRLQQWLDTHADVEIVDLQFQAFGNVSPSTPALDEPLSDAGGPSYATLILFRAPNQAETQTE